MTHQGNTCFCRFLLLVLLVLWSWSGVASAAEERAEQDVDLRALIHEGPMRSW